MLQPRKTKKIKKEESPREFFMDYINSKKYQDRLKTSNYENPIEESSKRLSNVLTTSVKEQEKTPSILQQLKNKITDTPYSTVGSKYKNNTIIFDKDQLSEFKKINPNITKEEVIAHEFGHAAVDSPDNINRLNKTDSNEFTNRLKSSIKNNHSLKPEENYSDIQSFRYLLNKEKIYDYKTEEFNKEHLDKAKKSFTKDRLLENYKEEDIIYLMNNIADNNKKTNNSIAKYGGNITDMKKRKKLMDGGYTDPYIQGANTINSSLISLSASMDAKKAAEKQALLAQRNDLNGKKAQDLLDSEEFEPEGYPLDTYYKKGGQIPSGIQYTKGGSVKPLSSDGAVMKGRSHEEGGIEIADGIEVEGDEAIKGNKVFSDTLKHRTGKTYADIAKQLMTKKGKLEDKLKSGNQLSSNTAKRQIEILDEKENRLFEEQEASKGEDSNNGKMDLGGVIKGTMPYVDNITNALLTLNTPKVAQPSYIKPRKMQTEINVNDQVGEVNNAVASSNRFIEGNTSNSAAARNAITTTNLRGVEAKGKIAARKDNIESQLKNRDAEYRSRIDTINAGKTDNYNAMQTARQGAIQSRISENAANLADDFVQGENFKEQQRYNDEELAALKAMYNPGVVGRTEARQQEILAELRKRRNARNTK